MKHEEDLTDYQQTIRDLSDRIVEAQRPVRILDALKWGDDAEHYFFENNCKKLPQIDKAYYEKNNPIGYDTRQKIKEFRDIERDIRRKLGQYSGIGGVMQRMCYEYIRTIEMLKARGTKRFTAISQELYGSSLDVFHIGAPSLKDLALLVSQTLTNVHDQTHGPIDEQIYTSFDAVEMLDKRMKNYFSDHQHIRVELSDGIIADAAAGADKLKIREGLLFSERQIRSLEVHEGWVHLATTLNGSEQPICTFLSKGAPSSTVTQEGLAIIMEMFTFSSYPERVRRLTNRIVAVNMAEEGANFFEVYNYYLDEGLNKVDAYQATLRIFRGSTPDEGPFTKDLSYSKGFILIYNYLRLAVYEGLLGRIPLLFIGKTSLDDLHVLADLAEEGIITPPRYVPPQFSDIAAVSAWMTYSLFLNKLDLDRLAIDFKAILK